MRGLALAMALVALPTFAEPPTPDLCADPVYRGRSPHACAPPDDKPVRRTILMGEMAPSNGCFLNDVACVATGKELTGLRAENASLKQSLEASAPAPLLIVGAFVLGIVGGGAIVYAVSR